MWRSLSTICHNRQQQQQQQRQRQLRYTTTLFPAPTTAFRILLTRATVMGWWDKAKKQGLKTKLRGQIHLVQREATVRKKKFGVDLYNLLTNDKQKLLGVSAGTLFKDQNTAELQAPFERAREDIAGMQARKDVKQKDLDVLEIKGAHTMPDYSIGDKAKKAGRHVADASVQAKIKAQMVFIDREMKIRKEQFGMEVFELAKESEQLDSGVGASMKSAIMNSISDQEKEIQAVIDTAKKDVAAIERKQKTMQREIGMLDEEMQPLSEQQDEGSHSESY